MRCLSASALLLGLVIGCSNKPDSPPVAGGGDEVRAVDSDPNATYTLRVRDVKEGDKTEVLRHEKVTEVRRGGGAGTIPIERRFEYSEHILEMPPDAELPTRLTRSYTVAQQTHPQSGKMEPLSFQGRSVTIEKAGGNYRFTVDGKPLPRQEAALFNAEFLAAKKVRIEALLPKQPVKVGESWTPEPDVLAAFGYERSIGVVLPESTLSCKLARAYTLDGKQWAQVAFDFKLVINPNTSNSRVRGNEGTHHLAGTYDVVIDGSARDGAMKGTLMGELTGRHKAGEVKITLDGTMETTVRTVK